MGKKTILDRAVDAVAKVNPCAAVPRERLAIDRDRQRAHGGHDDGGSMNVNVSEADWEVIFKLTAKQCDISPRDVAEVVAAYTTDDLDADASAEAKVLAEDPAAAVKPAACCVVRMTDGEWIAVNAVRLEGVWGIAAILRQPTREELFQAMAAEVEDGAERGQS